MDEPILKGTGEKPHGNGAEAQDGGRQQSQNVFGGDAPVAGSTLQTATVPALEGIRTTYLPAGYLSQKLADAELLLGHAAQTGLEVDDTVRAGVLKARLASDAGTLTEPLAAGLLAALTKLAADLHPVTAESLRACGNLREARKVIRFYGKVAILLTCLIVPISLSTFVSSHVSASISKDLDSANVLAVKLRDELGPPPQQPTSEVGLGTNVIGRGGVTEKDVISDLQVFAATVRAIEGQSRQLNRFVVYSVTDPFASLHSSTSTNRSPLELTPGLGVLYAQESADRIAVYQRVRSFAQAIQQRVSIYYGAIGACILPALYALLGACAYLLRSYEEQIRTCTLTVADRHGARFLIAGIGGLVVGLFNVTQPGTSLPPLAIAFLVGYGTDVFFSFLEGFLVMFKRDKGPAAKGK